MNFARKRTNEHPLGKLIGLEILEEQGGVLNSRKPVWVGHNGVEHDFWIMFPHLWKSVRSIKNIGGAEDLGWMAIPTSRISDSKK